MPASERATRGRFSPTTGLVHSQSVLRVFKCLSGATANIPNLCDPQANLIIVR
jgi:hypothetical protein